MPCEYANPYAPAGIATLTKPATVAFADDVESAKEMYGTWFAVTPGAKRTNEPDGIGAPVLLKPRKKRTLEIESLSPGISVSNINDCVLE